VASIATLLRQRAGQLAPQVFFLSHAGLLPLQEAQQQSLLVLL
jgi:hypothetical protein